ncbi:cation transporter [Agrococcus sediminis]|uniref:Cation transporter n=1 Tax=Agrococcus sediminis TaxID=2599924 RepID=A0A5M8QIQ8_9MICO|nr:MULTISPECIES: cation diffusion facilitator family transporter [Agrococcus]KAA6435148.1 cation transporter [Agrococcus sediminis]MDR7233454.1 cobalt-zinc-cadmium efflux system protein [Agrococcus sp. BE272]RWR25384.1 cation transporter [Agrococcus lahaulensis]UOW02006.1 cation diffusion facilitator family transporter [Agrococcus sp. SCSIO52902]
MAAGHSHGSTDGAPAATGDFRVRLGIAFALTATIVVAQLIGSVVTGSLALLTDTAHAVTDAAGLLVALIAASLMRRPATSRRTWGFRRIEVIAALGQATLLLAVGVYAAVEGIRRLFEPPEIPASELVVFGVIGLVVNIIAILVLSSGRGANFNMRAAFLEVLNDALGSLGVIAAAIVIWTTGFQQADAIAGLFIAALIAPRALILMKETAGVLMEFTPKDLDLDDVRRHILELDHVEELHDLHASTVATGLPTISAHVVVDDSCFADGHAVEVLEDIQRCVAEHFPVSVHHSTFQLETSRISEQESAAVRHP